MPGRTHISAVIVNHNTSPFVELLLRTLFDTEKRAGFDLQITVLDNASDDSGLLALHAVLGRHGLTFRQTGFDTSVAGEKHGDALRAFVRTAPPCTHFLFLDADMWFMEPNTVAAMIAEVDAAPHAFAVQARIAGYYAGRVIEGADGVSGAGAATDWHPWPLQVGERSYVARVAPRCSPVCCLVRDTPVFRGMVEHVGCTPAVALHADGATYYDTFGLLTAAMAGCGQPFVVSARTVNHFTETTYRPDLRALKDQDCRAMLDLLRGGHGMTDARFRASPWVRAEQERTPRAT